MEHVVAEVAARDVDPERKRQARLEQPPLAEVDTLWSPCDSYVSWPSWIRSPAWARPDFTSSMISSKGTSRKR